MVVAVVRRPICGELKLSFNGDIVLPVASSGIATTLLPSGRTAHSWFKIPIVLDEFSVCNIGQDSDIAELIKSTKLIIWEEAPMQHRYAFECLDHSLKDIMKFPQPNMLPHAFWRNYCSSWWHYTNSTCNSKC